MLQTRVLTPRSRTTHVVWARNGRGASAPGRRNRGADIINKREPASAISGDATTRNRTKFHLSKAGRKRKPTVAVRSGSGSSCEDDFQGGRDEEGESEAGSGTSTPATSSCIKKMTVKAADKRKTVAAVISSSGGGVEDVFEGGGKGEDESEGWEDFSKEEEVSKAKGTGEASRTKQQRKPAARKAKPPAEEFGESVSGRESCTAAAVVAVLLRNSQKELMSLSTVCVL